MNAKTYLQFNGNCEEAMNFYADVLGGTITQKMKFSDAPEADLQFPKEMMNKIMHCALQAENIQLMASDYASEYPFQQGNNFAISIDTTDEDQAFSVFSSLSEGGQVLMPFEEAFWGGKFGMLVDKYGVSWMLSLTDGKAMA